MSKPEKKEKAMRIFGALSSVDEELLVRAEEKMPRVLSFGRVTQVMAACACLLVVGLVTWTGSRSFVTKESAANDCAAPESVTEMMADAEAAMDEEGEVYDEYDSAGTVAEEVMEDVPAEQKEFETSTAVTENVSAEKAEAIWDVGTPLEDLAEYLGEEELRAVTGFGEYIPTRIPEGYIFESGVRMYEGGINLTWSKGLDSFTVSVLEYEATEENAMRIADISAPETYDVHLYDIPYSDTVPEEYWLIFNNPIFEEKVFTQAVVSARMKSVEELGDTDTPRGNFSVLYDCGMLVSFSGDCDAASIWTMFESVGK